MDAIKLVGVVLLVAMAVAALSTAIGALTTGASMGRAAFHGIAAGWEESDGQSPGWSPLSAAGMAFGALTGDWQSWGASSGPLGWLAGIAGSLVAVVVGFFLLRLAYRVWGS